MSCFELHSGWSRGRFAAAGWAAALSVTALFACSPDGSHESRSPGDSGVPAETPNQPREGREFCGREGRDEVRDVFCQEAPPDLSSLRALQERLHTAFASPDAGGSEGSYAGGYGDPVRLVLLSHSTALSGRLVTPINPRAIMLGPGTALAFNRGVQQVELASRDRKTYGFNFYLVSFEQACNAAPGGCTPGDLYTPRVESNWTRVRIQDDEDLKNTPSDCRQCHERGRKAPILLMRELDGPWTHFFMPDGPQTAGSPEASGVDLMHEYDVAKGNEAYAGIPAGELRRTAGITLQNAMEVQQPIVFDGSTILNERWPWTPEAGYVTKPVASPTWFRDYEAFKRGELLPLPYYAPHATDADKQARLTVAYRRYLERELGADELPDLGEIFPEDPQTRAEIGLQTEPAATPAQALVQACGSCHNDVLDQEISRARFNVDLARMDRAELDVAIARITAEADAPEKMPPSGRRELDAEGRARLVEYLRSGARTGADDAFLAEASRLGMAGKQPPSPL